MRVREVTADHIVLSVGNNVQRHTLDWNTIDTTSGDTVTFSNDPHFVLYAFPLEVGKEWSGKWGMKSTRFTYPTSWTATIKVVGTETVTVPAGTFETFKLVFRGHYNRASGDAYPVNGVREETLWYSPVVKRAVKGEWTERGGSYYNIQKYELASYQVAP